MTGAVTWGDLQKLAAEAGFTNPAAGDYLMEVTKATYKKSANGNDMIVIVLKVINPGPNAGATQPHNLVASPNSMGFFMRYAAALGFDAAFFASYAATPIAQTLQILAPMLVGRRAAVTIGPDRNDPERLVVAKMSRPPAGSDAVATAPLIPVPQAAQAAAVSVSPPPPPPPSVAAAVPAAEPEQAPEAGIEPPDLPF